MNHSLPEPIPGALLHRLTAPGPKRMLALDGGGIRGLQTICFLRKIEAVLRQRYGRPDYRLCEYFDLIGGTSTGAIIAGGLAIGLDVQTILDVYVRLGPKIFGKIRSNFWDGLFHHKPLEEALEQHFQDITLGDPRIRTGLCIVAKRADSNSTWPLINHPGGRFYADNGSLLLRHLVRASAAAPVFFTPKSLDIAPGQKAAFVDGGVSMANNPALLLFMVATLQGFPFRWDKGEDKLMIVSVGTGTWQWRMDSVKMARDKFWKWLMNVPKMLIQDADWQAQALLQYMGRSLNPWQIDLEMGDLQQDCLCNAPLFTYVRYNTRLEAARIQEAGVDLPDSQVEVLRRLNATSAKDDHIKVGDAFARMQVMPEHFPRSFDTINPSFHSSTEMNR